MKHISTPEPNKNTTTILETVGLCWPYMYDGICLKYTSWSVQLYTQPCSSCGHGSNKIRECNCVSSGFNIQYLTKGKPDRIHFDKIKNFTVLHLKIKCTFFAMVCTFHGKSVESMDGQWARNNWQLDGISWKLPPRSMQLKRQFPTSFVQTVKCLNSINTAR